GAIKTDPRNPGNHGGGKASRSRGSTRGARGGFYRGTPAARRLEGFSSSPPTTYRTQTQTGDVCQEPVGKVAWPRCRRRVAGCEARERSDLAEPIVERAQQSRRPPAAGNPKGRAALRPISALLPSGRFASRIASGHASQPTAPRCPAAPALR